MLEVVASSFHFIHLCPWSTALAFLLFGHNLQVFRVYVRVHGFRHCHVRGTIVWLLYTAYECVACFVLWNWMDVNMNTIILRLHPTRGSPKMYASSLMRGIIVVHAMICTRSSEYPPEIGLQARSGKHRKIRTRGQDLRVKRVALLQAAVGCKKTDPRVRPAGQPKTTRGSW